MDPVPRPRAIFGVTKRDIPGVLNRSQTMYTGFMANIGMFGSPTITMVAFLALITALLAAQQTTSGTKAKGSAALRNAKAHAVWTAMEILRAYAQGLADVLNADNAIALIESAGLLVAAAPRHQKDTLAATLTSTPGLVHLDANASVLAGTAARSKRVQFNWQWSGDSGKTWNDVHSTPHANTDVVGLALMSTYSFRVSCTIAKVTGAWSQPVGLLVH
jgi:hypothetical protein